MRRAARRPGIGGWTCRNRIAPTTYTGVSYAGPSNGRRSLKQLLRACLALAMGAASVCNPAAADSLVVITNPAIRLDADDVRDVFLGEKQIAGGVKLVPIDNSSAQPAFLAKVIKLDETKYTAAWIKKSFRDGLTPPAVKANDAEVSEFVRRVPGAVGYVSTVRTDGVVVVRLP